jgi:sugar lactone lactonase YvrE
MQWTTVIQEPSQLGESPFWHPQEQCLYWVDIVGMQIKRANVFMGEVEVWDMPSEPGCIAPAASGGLVIALRDRIVRAHQWRSKLVTLNKFTYDVQKIRFNDGKCDPQGRFWAGTIYEPKDARKADLYSLDARGGHKPVVQLKAHNATTANGLAWSADQKTVYWADTPRHVIHAWRYDSASNGMTQHRVFQQFAPKPAGWQPFQPDNGGYAGRPDGASVDALGNYWVAMYEGQRVLQLSPHGDILQSIATPVLCPTMVCFGGDDLQTLYLTSARHGRSAQDLQMQPLMGAVFSTRVQVPGLAVNYFED